MITKDLENLPLQPVSSNEDLDKTLNETGCSDKAQIYTLI